MGWVGLCCVVLRSWVLGPGSGGFVFDAGRWIGWVGEVRRWVMDSMSYVVQCGVVYISVV